VIVPTTPTAAAPLPPFDVTATNGTIDCTDQTVATPLTIRWNGMDDVQSYNVKVRQSSGTVSYYSQFASGITAKSYALGDGWTGISGYFVVTAVRNGLESHPSSEVSGVAGMRAVSRPRF
jgi:hypothetical protein